MDKREIESNVPEVETEIRGVVGVMIKIVIDQIGKEVIAMNIEIHWRLKHQNKKTEKLKHDGHCNSWSTE